MSAFEQAGIDVSINPRAVTAEEIVRFAHDPRTQQVAMLEGNRYEVLDVTTRESSRYIGMAFRDMPVHGSIIGAHRPERHARSSRTATTCSRRATA